MKHIKYLIVFLILLVSFSNVSLADTKEKEGEKVNVYMLTKDGCSGCTAAYEYFDSLKEEDPDLFDLVPFEVFDKNWEWNSVELQTLFTEVYTYFKEDTSSASTPTIVIGEYHTLGLPKDKTEIIDAIKETSKSGKDAIKKIAEKNNLNIDELKYDRSAKAEDIQKNNDTIIVIGIFAVLIGGFVLLVIAGKK